MREILFRGKRVCDNEWIYGDLVQYLGFGKVRIIPNYTGAGAEDVIPETAGQYTGLTDKNGNEIFEGDVLRNDTGVVYGGTYNATVKYDKGEWIAEYVSKDLGIEIIFLASQFKRISIIGNIHDNPELLEKGV